jgi:two-component sensor histidine kinase
LRRARCRGKSRAGEQATGSLSDRADRRARRGFRSCAAGEDGAADTRIAAQQVVSLALAVHELATNACKSGALSVREGWVPLRIEEAGDRIKLLWREHGGPPVVPPEAKGFGSRLLGRLGSQPS